MSGMFADDNAAAQALADANTADSAPAVPATQAPVEQAAPPAVPTSTVDAGTNHSESFTNIDVNSLPPEIRAQVEEAIKPFQADYTRKTQEIAAFRQTLTDTGMSAEEAQQALTFVQSLNDPAQLQELYTNLQERFASEPGFEDGSVDPQEAALQSLSSRLERFEQAQQMTEAKAALADAVASVQSANPDFKEADMSRVQQLAVAHMQGSNNDLSKSMTAAASEYASWRNETVASYIEQKGQVSANGTPNLGGQGHAETPSTPFANLDEATKAALARFGNSI